ncbi:MAG: hypothetical protein FD135_2346 [Comamonadaceae bacterium]|nr:MAG: hypothetical protein FD135_2346 [Comamonadaceae bacterium]
MRATLYTVDGLMGMTFCPGRKLPNAAYLAGARAWFDRHLTKAPILCPYFCGTAEFDAFWAGDAEAREVIRLEQIEVVNTWKRLTPADFARLTESLQMSHHMQIEADDVWAEHGMLAAIVYMQGA